MIPTAVLRLCGHASGAPNGVLSQSKARMRSPNSPPPDRNGGQLSSERRSSIGGSTKTSWGEVRQDREGRYSTATAFTTPHPRAAELPWFRDLPSQKRAEFPFIS